MDHKAFTERFINTDAFVVMARRNAFPHEPVSKTAKALRISRQAVYRAYQRIMRAGFGHLLPMIPLEAYQHLE